MVAIKEESADGENDFMRIPFRSSEVVDLTLDDDSDVSDCYWHMQKRKVTAEAHKKHKPALSKSRPGGEKSGIRESDRVEVNSGDDGKMRKVDQKPSLFEEDDSDEEIIVDHVEYTASPAAQKLEAQRAESRRLRQEALERKSGGSLEAHKIKSATSILRSGDHERNSLINPEKVGGSQTGGGRMENPLKELPTAHTQDPGPVAGSTTPHSDLPKEFPVPKVTRSGTDDGKPFQQDGSKCAHTTGAQSGSRPTLGGMPPFKALPNRQVSYSTAARKVRFVDEPTEIIPPLNYRPAANEDRLLQAKQLPEAKSVKSTAIGKEGIVPAVREAQPATQSAVEHSRQKVAGPQEGFDSLKALRDKIQEGNRTRARVSNVSLSPAAAPPTSKPETRPDGVPPSEDFKASTRKERLSTTQGATIPQKRACPSPDPSMETHRKFVERPSEPPAISGHEANKPQVQVRSLSSKARDDRERLQAHQPVIESLHDAEESFVDRRYPQLSLQNRMQSLPGNAIAKEIAKKASMPSETTEDDQQMAIETAWHEHDLFDAKDTHKGAEPIHSDLNLGDSTTGYVPLVRSSGYKSYKQSQTQSHPQRKEAVASQRDKSHERRLGEITHAEVQLVKLREEGMDWPEIQHIYERLSGKDRAVKTLRELYRRVKAALTTPRITPQLLKDVLLQHHDAREQLNLLVHGEERLAEIKASPRLAAGAPRPALHTDAPSGLRLFNGLKLGNLQQPSPLSSFSGDDSEPYSAPRPTSAGKTINHEAIEAYYAGMIEAADGEDSETEGEAARDPSPMTEEDFVHWLYRVVRKQWGPEDDIEEEDELSWVVCSKSFDNLAQANAVASNQVLKSWGEKASVFADGHWEMSNELDKHGMVHASASCKTTGGHVRCKVERFLRTFHEGKLPTSKIGWLPKVVYYVKERTTTKIGDGVYEEAHTTVETKFVDNTTYTTSELANTRAGDRYMELTVRPTSTNMHQNDIERAAARRQMEARIVELESNEEFFRQSAEDEQTTVEIWVEEGNLSGPRNL